MKTRDKAGDILAENETLRQQLAEAQETLRAIQHGEVDALIVSTPEGEQVYSITGAEKPYRILIEEMKEGAVMLSEGDMILYCNKGFAKIIKQPLDTLIGKIISGTINPTHLNSFHELIALSRKDGSTKEKDIAFMANDGTVVPAHVSVNSSLKLNLETTFLVITDLTQHMQQEVKRYTTDLELEIAARKKAEEALTKKQDELQTIIDSSQGLIFYKDLENHFIRVNKAFAEVMGLPKEQLEGRSLFELYPKEEAEAYWNDDKQVIASGKVKVGIEEKMLSKQGQRWVLTDKIPYRDTEGNIFGVIGFSVDITERKKAEEILNKLNEELEERVLKRTEEVSAERQRLYKVLETLPAYVILLDKDYCVPFANKVFRERFGESHGRCCYDFLFKRESPCENCETYKVLKNNGPHRWEWTGPDGRDYDIYDFPFVEADGSTLILEMGIDITERKKLEKQVKDSERLAAIGATAGMVGHDIRNPLQAITSDIYLAKTDLSSIPESEEKKNVLESLHEIEKNVDYINKIVADLQDFARPIAPKLEEIDLEETVHSVIAKLNIPGNVTVKHSIKKGFPKINVDQSYIQRILTNLLNNAIQAMPNGGKLTIAAATKNGKAIISVEDTGEGIPEAVRGRLFTPLVTSKSKGQGFGLSVVKRFTEGMGGTVTFESVVGKGTKFIIELPL